MSTKQNRKSGLQNHCFEVPFIYLLWINLLALQKKKKKDRLWDRPEGCVKGWRWLVTATGLLPPRGASAYTCRPCLTFPSTSGRSSCCGRQAGGQRRGDLRGWIPGSPSSAPSSSPPPFCTAPDPTVSFSQHPPPPLPSRDVRLRFGLSARGRGSGAFFAWFL